MATMTMQVDSYFELEQTVIEVVDITMPGIEKCETVYSVTVTPANSTDPSVTSVIFSWQELLQNPGTIFSVQNVSENGVPRVGAATNGETVTGVNEYKVVLKGFRGGLPLWRYATIIKLNLRAKKTASSVGYFATYSVSRRGTTLPCPIFE
jgi:hypothetical protein